MSDRSRLWLIGCSVAAAAVLAVVIALVGGGYFVAKQVVGEFQETAEMMDRVSDLFGEVEDFRPQADGIIPAERIELFLQVRSRLAPRRQKLEESLLTLSEANQGKRSKGIFSMVRSGVGLLPLIVRFLSERNEALLEMDMGPGEYVYLYAIAFYCWLGKSPADGPSFRLVGDGEDPDDHGQADEFEVREERRERSLNQLNRVLLAMLKNQLADLRKDSEYRKTLAEWETSLEAEIRALESDAYRLPWYGRLPEQMESSLQPFQDRLNQSYSEMCNALETGAGIR